MPGARQRRRRKHRGTQAGTVRRRGRTSSHSSRTEAGEDARQGRVDRRNRPPTWRAAINRAGIAASVFLALLVLVLKQSFGVSLSIALFVLVIYAPLFYFTDSLMYRFRQRRKQRETGD